MQSRLEDFRNAGAEVLTLSVDDIEHNAKVSKSLGLNFPILSDVENTVIRAWGVVDQGGGIGGADIARPATFILDAEGIIRWRDLASNWRIRSSPDEIIEAIHRMDLMGPFGAGGEQTRR